MCAIKKPTRYLKKYMQPKLVSLWSNPSQLTSFHTIPYSPAPNPFIPSKETKTSYLFLENRITFLISHPVVSCQLSTYIKLNYVISFVQRSNHVINQIFIYFSYFSVICLRKLFCIDYYSIGPAICLFYFI